MNHHQGGRGRKFHGEITITHSVQAVGIDAIEAKGRCSASAINRYWSACQSCSSQRREIQPFAQVRHPLPVPFNHLHVGKKMVSEAKRLGTLQMRVARNQGVAVKVGLVEQGALKAEQMLLKLIQTPPKPKTQIGPHLVVTTPTGVQFLANRTEQGNQTSLNSEVHIFIG